MVSTLDWGPGSLPGPDPASSKRRSLDILLKIPRSAFTSMVKWVNKPGLMFLRGKKRTCEDVPGWAVLCGAGFIHSPNQYGYIFPPTSSIKYLLENSNHVLTERRQHRNDQSIVGWERGQRTGTFNTAKGPGTEGVCPSGQ